MAATAGPRRVGLTKNASPLLRLIGGKQHAQDKDHEGVQQNKDMPQEPQEDYNAPPIDSDDEELRNPPPKPPSERLKLLIESTNDEDNLRKPPGSNRKRKARESILPTDTELGLKHPRAVKKASNTAPRAPREGSFKQNQAAKAGYEGNKENTTGSETPPSSSGNIWLERFKWSSSQTSQSGKKVDYSSRKTSSQPTSNIHAAPASAKQQPGKPKTFSHKATKKLVEPEDDDNSSEISMLDDEEINQMGAELTAEKEAEEQEKRDLAELGLNVPTRRKVAQRNSEPAGLSAMDHAELDATLATPTLQEQLGLTGRQEGSLPPSSAPQEDMDDIDDFVRELPIEADEGTACPICSEPVDQDYYWTFWKGLDKTVKNQAAFCHTHKKATAQKEYLDEGYPAIDGVPSIHWANLADRIKKHRMALYSILTNETPSQHRARYAPLALTGKAAAVPSKRTDLSPSKQQELETYALDSNAVYPGYYGPRGRRLITEAVMSLLNTEIKRSTDPVVMTSGPATFVQAVLVPEVAVRLIMEDLQCDQERAEEVREATFEMGGLLNEEIEDSVEVEEGEEENEYHP
ncbi:hypothetical protein E8E12_009693 [Didymella heteroderae]|uniref:Restriction of telomere capping protein 4 n=1 Tax=Didymella heteroderae TaxID=1769908 RepID=A0A9P5C5V8_9PLEO|nr:hypothetical protein E8E12_009693 [Didymella heteroderae]